MRKIGLTSSLAVLTVAASLAINGCSKHNPQPAETPAQPTSQPQSQSQPASQAQPTAQQAAATTPAPASAPAPQPAQPQTPPPPARITIPAGTPIRVRLDQDLGSKISQTGETFSATLASPVIVHGQTVIPQDARAEGAVIEARRLGRFRGQAVLALRLERVTTRWGSYAVNTSTMSQVEKGKGRRTAGFVGGGGALGAIIGGIAGGGKGALIGGLAGAGAGAAGTAMTGNREIFLPSETLVTFRLDHSVHITE